MGNRRRVRSYPGGYTFESCETINSVIDQREESERKKKPVTPQVRSHSDEAQIIDDGTMDTVVEFLGVYHRFSTEYRNEFENDSDFLSAVLDEIYENIQ